MKNQIKTLLAAAVIMAMMSPVGAASSSSSSANKLVRTHQNAVVDQYNAFESEALRISFNDSFNGFAEGKVCDLCEEIKVTITPKTKAYENNIEVPLRNAKSRIGRYATVMFEVESKRAVAIHW